MDHTLVRGMTAAALPPPEIVGCFFDDGFTPKLLAMRLLWPVAEGQSEECAWVLPLGDVFNGPAPREFGFSLHRTGDDQYDARLRWDSRRIHWTSLRRADLLESSLPVVLAAMGTDLHYLLDQPISEPSPSRHLKAG